MTEALPISVIIPTLNRSLVLEATLLSLAKQAFFPLEIIVIDASSNRDTQNLLIAGIKGLRSRLIYHKAVIPGAATQRNEGMMYATQGYVLFMDDDILLEQGCIQRLWEAMMSDISIGGVNALITNQKYSKPGKISSLLFRILHGKKEVSYAGKCIGPGLNLLPEDNHELPVIVQIEWLNTTCTLYRREALPDPVFTSNFTGYSLMEDVALSLQIGKKWKLMNARTAKIFHDSQPGNHKNNVAVRAKMELLNRHYVMVNILERKDGITYLKLLLLESFGVVTALVRLSGWKNLPSVLYGKFAAIIAIVKAQ